MIWCSLDVPDDLDQPYDPRWSPTISLALRQAYDLMRRGEYERAISRIAPYEASARADLQRMRIHYVLGTCTARLCDVRGAIGHLDTALDIAARIDDLAATASLAYLDGPLHYEAHSAASAAEYYSIALDALHTLDERGITADPRRPRFELEIHFGLATQYFLLDHHAEAERSIAQGRYMAALAPEQCRRRASLDWLSALVERWRGNASKAREFALLALGEYREVGAPNELARLLAVLAEIELDLAARAPNAALLAEIQVHIGDALAYARTCGDRCAEGLALLARARHAQVVTADEDGRCWLRAALEIATDLNDAPLLGQAYSALGDELAARGQHSSAIPLYHSALAAFADAQAPALALWTRHGLRRAEELVADE